MSVIELDRYRQRRTVRRAAALVVAAGTMLAVLDACERAWDTFAGGLRLAVRLLPDEEGETDEHS